jgi:hypothetical protein
MKKGFDAKRDLSRFANCLLIEGYTFICRYYNINNPSKNLTYAEANFLSSLGLSIVAVWENGYPTSSSYFTYRQGVADGTAAYEYALTTIYQPDLTPIYFAVDYDASEEDVTGVIADYFKGILASFKQISDNNPKYFIGVYGSGHVCKWLKQQNLALYTWLAQSTGWRGSKTYKDYNIKQLAQSIECIELGTVKGDPNESPHNNEGSFKVNQLMNLLTSTGLILINNPIASVCESSPTWDTAPKPSKNPLTEMKWANDLDKDRFGCTRKDAAGKKKFHGGIDIRANVGTDCYAIEDGKVTARGYGDDLGKYIAIKFEKDGKVYGAGYCHLSNYDIVKIGDTVTAGQLIGKTGKTGNVGSDNPHLHLEVHDQEWLTYEDEVKRSAHSLNPNDYIP